MILGFGRLTDQKGFPTLIRAFAIVRTRREARLVIVGEGRPEARDHLQQLAADLACASDLSLPGFTYNPFCYMAAASVFVLSSLREGLPGMLIQALACGVPVVSTDCPSGPREILEGGTYGRWWHSGTTPRWPRRSSTPSINRETRKHGSPADDSPMSSARSIAISDCSRPRACGFPRHRI